MPTQVQELQDLLDAHSDKRVSVIAPTSVGKSTFLQYIKNAHDQDELWRERIAKRGVNFTDADNMRRSIERDIKKAGVPIITFEINGG